MLYHLFTTLREMYDLPGAGLFNFVSFRAGMSLMTSLVVGILFGKRIIERLQLKQVGEIVRDLGLEGQMNKQGTPTMGGLIILGAILLPTLLFADLTNVYTQLMILSTCGSAPSASSTTTSRCSRRTKRGWQDGSKSLDKSAWG